MDIQIILPGEGIAVEIKDLFYSRIVKENGFLSTKYSNCSKRKTAKIWNANGKLIKRERGARSALESLFSDTENLIFGLS